MMKNHYESLDGMRFIAATGVLLFHLGHWLGVGGLVPNAGIAVDFFFCLSGFVMVIAYQEKIAAIHDLWVFFRIRVLRLWPMITVSTLISASYLAMKGFVSPDAPSAFLVLHASVLSLLSVPYLDAPASLGGPQVFPLNGPQYSLFLEIVVNIFWAFILIIVPRRFYLPLSILFVVISATFLLAGGFGGDTTENFWLGFPRVTCSFFIGVVAANVFLKQAKPSLFAHVLFLLALTLTGLLILFPIPIGRLVTMWIIVAAPILVVGGAHWQLSPSLKKMAIMGGVLSYPIYTLHYPLFCWMNGIFVMALKSQAGLVEVAILFPAILAVCYVATILFELPMMSVLRRPMRPARRDAR